MTPTIRRISIPLLAGALALAALAARSAVPEGLAGVTIARADDVVKLVQAGATVIDTRVPYEFAEEHIKGAKHVPYKEKSAKSPEFDAGQDGFDLRKLPPDKDAPVVFYCDSDSWKSYKAAVVATRAGYKKVNWFRGGMPEWKSRKLPVE